MPTALTFNVRTSSCLFQWSLGNATVAAYKNKTSLVAFCPFVLFMDFNEIKFYKDVEL